MEQACDYNIFLNNKRLHPFLESLSQEQDVLSKNFCSKLQLRTIFVIENGENKFLFTGSQYGSTKVRI
jgi:hypothetical protein